MFTVWFFEYDKNFGCFVKQYDIFSGSRYQCYKIKNSKSFSWQYKVIKNYD